ncbi:hypothetical protein BE21_23090 [Sorangium cellulosum]|uniref:Uncharacterized protein n=1 Tax=Sorangium cellulosum TaxID=56 RepID=A0A150TVM2_SORCE|nr:hypothetical protein BE21_23090 [Sorangium cellulosum]
MGAAAVVSVKTLLDRLDALEKSHAWYREWSETARAFIKRRDFLVRLGLAHRKAKAKVKPSPAAPSAL